MSVPALMPDQDIGPSVSGKYLKELLGLCRPSHPPPPRLLYVLLSIIILEPNLKLHELSTVRAQYASEVQIIDNRAQGDTKQERSPRAACRAAAAGRQGRAGCPLPRGARRAHTCESLVPESVQSAVAV